MKKNKNTKIITVGFYVSGYITTEVEIPADLDNKEFEKGLNNNTYLTSIVPGAPILVVNDNFEHVGKVLEIIEPDLEYSSFRVDNGE